MFAAGLLAGCATTNIDSEERVIGIESGAVPASVDAADLKNGHLLRDTSKSYVTLSVSQDDSALVARASDRRNRALTSGSGFVVETSGYVLTAAHVGVLSSNLVTARAADGRIYSGTVLAVLPGNDIALIKLKNFSGPKVRPASVSCLAKGDEVFSHGKPHSQGDVARLGKVESMHFGRAVRYGKFGYPDAIVLRMNTQKGESGGPLFDSGGNLSGMIVSTLADGNGKPLNLAHAIPATALASFYCKNAACPGDGQRRQQNSKLFAPGQRGRDS